MPREAVHNYDPDTNKKEMINDMGWAMGKRRRSVWEKDSYHFFFSNSSYGLMALMASSTIGDGLAKAAFEIDLLFRLHFMYIAFSTLRLFGLQSLSFFRKSCLMHANKSFLLPSAFSFSPLPSSSLLSPLAHVSPPQTEFPPKTTLRTHK